MFNLITVQMVVQYCINAMGFFIFSRTTLEVRPLNQFSCLIMAASQFAGRRP